MDAYPSEGDGLRALLAEAAPGDVVAVMTHQDRAELDDWLRAHGATVDGAEDLRRKVLAAAAC